ncbi:MAG: hypothetical protein PHT16_00530 [Candidatus Pacebacteria bacterium]|nr:hypothetical protein [Candidatus Paceibacterota bacterium]
MEPETKNCQNCKKDFTIEPDDFKFYEKINVPPPTFCPECRTIRRMLFRNERALYKKENSASKSKEKIISMYSSESPYIIYDKEYWINEANWDSRDYGVDYDFNKSFFEQFHALDKKVPKYALYNINPVRSNYCNICVDMKDCYLVFGSWYSENCQYGDTVLESKNCIDNSWINKCELSSQLINSDNCYQTFFAQDCANCIDCWFVYDCKNCQNCLFSSNLRNQQFCIVNKVVSKEEFNKTKESLLNSLKSPDGLNELFDKYKKVKSAAIHKFMIGKNYVNATGNFINNSKNVKKSHFTSEVDNVRYSIRSVKGQKDTSDVYGVSGGELAYESLNVDFSSNILSALHGLNLINVSYSIDCDNCNNLFGCIGLHNKSYCILNHQYTKEQYEALVPKIIKHMNDMPYIDSKGRIYQYGEFFPVELSPFCYNETIAQEYFPLTKEEAIKQGYKWKDAEERNYTIDIKTKDIPDNIKEVDESILGKVIECEHQGKCNEQCTEAFKIIAPELQFYQRMNLPLPHLCPNCRHYQRLKQRNPLKLWHRACMCEKTTHTHIGKCPTEFETSYAPERKEIVYCERCYQGEVY